MRSTPLPSCPPPFHDAFNLTLERRILGSGLRLAGWFYAVLLGTLFLAATSNLLALDDGWPHREYSPSAANLTDADVLGPDGLVYPNWTLAGVQGGIPEITGPVFAVSAPSGTGDSAAIMEKINEAGLAGGGVVQLQEGVYLLDRPLKILHDGVVLRGVSREMTRLQFICALGLRELRWFTPEADGAELFMEDVLEVHFSGVASKSLRFKVDSTDVSSSVWGWDAQDGNHLYSSNRLLTNLMNAGVVQNGQMHTIEAIMTWQDNTTSSVSRSFVARNTWKGVPGLRRHATGEAAISIGGDVWTGRGGYRWSLYKTAPRGSRDVFVFYDLGDEVEAQAGWLVRLDGQSSDAWDLLVDNTGMTNTEISQFFEVEQVRDPVSGELTEPVPVGKGVKVVRMTQPLRHRYVIGDTNAGGMSPRLDGSQFAVQWVGIESLTLEQPENLLDPGHDDELFSDGIKISMARNCWIRDVRMITVGRNPVAVGGLNNEVRDCRFDGSWWTHVGQGTAYVGFGKANDFLFENIVGLHLRHSPNAQWGANGNVFRNSVFYGADAQYHFGWAHDNLYEQVEIDARRFPTAIRGDEGIANGSYGYGIYGQNGHNTIHSPGCGPRNVIYRCDTLSSNSAIYLGDASERFMALHNRFRITGDAPGMILNDRVHDAIFRNNVFVLNGAGQPLIEFPLDHSLNAISNQPINQNIGNLGIEVTQQTIYRNGSGTTLAQGTGVDTESGNSWETFEIVPAPPTTNVPSIFAWQRALPQMVMETPLPWAEAVVGEPLTLTATITGHENAIVNVAEVRWLVGGEVVATGASAQWAPRRVDRVDLRVEAELQDGSVLYGPSRLLKVEASLNDLPISRSQVHLRWRADANQVTLDPTDRVLTWSDLKAGVSAERDGAKTFYVGGIPGLVADPETGPLWVANAFGDKPALRFDAANDGLAYARPKDDDLGLERGQPRTIFLVFRYSENNPGQIFGASNNDRIAIDDNGGNRVDLRRSAPANLQWDSSNNILTRNTVQILAVRGDVGRTDLFVGGVLVGGLEEEVVHYEHTYGSIRLGSGAFYGRDFRGDLAEAIVVVAALPDGDIQSVSNQLSQYYSQTSAAVPGGFLVAPTIGSQLLLTWTQAPGANSYEIQRQADDGVWESLARPLGVITSWTDSEAIPGEAHTYRIRAISSTGDSGWSEEDSATTWTMLEAWRHDWFGSVLNSGNAANHANPDNGALVNLLEFASKTNPTDSSDDQLPTAVLTDINGTDYMSISYLRRSGGSGTTGVDYSADGVTYSVECSTDLSTWNSGATFVEKVGEPLNNEDGTETVTVRMKAALNSNRAFMRLKVTEN